MNQTSTRRRLRYSALVGSTVLGLLVAAGASAQTAPMPATTASGGMGKPMMSGMEPGGASKEMQSSMSKGMEAMSKMKPSGDTDKDFAMMMKMHHQQALEMAKPEVEHGKSPEMKALARKIIKDQTKEIGQLDAWMKKHP